MWGLTALLDAPEDVARVHRSYIDVGCDVICTNTWGLPTALRDGTSRLSESSEPVHWMDIVRRAVGLARSAAQDAGRADEVAIAFSLNGDVDTPDGRETIALLSRAFEEEPPDLILLETLSLVRSSTYATVEALLDTGIPVWLSFRRCRQGVCGVYGEHWGGPEGDAFGRAARRFEEMGVGALAINCIPPDHVAGMLSWLRDFTDLPLGVYPNLGYLSAAGWREEPGVKGKEYAELALSWRDEGAQIIGGCCGVRPEHLQGGTDGADRHQARARAADGADVGERPERQTPRASVLGRPAGARDVPARHARDRRRGRRVHPDAGQLPHLEVPVPRGRRGPPALPGHRVGQRPAHGAARAERGRARPCDRHRPDLGQEHAHQRVSQRRRRPGERRGTGPVPVGPRGTLRRDRGQPLPDAGRPVRAGRPPTGRWTTGAAICSTTSSGSCPRPWPTTERRT